MEDWGINEKTICLKINESVADERFYPLQTLWSDRVAFAAIVPRTCLIILRGMKQFKV